LEAEGQVRGVGSSHGGRCALCSLLLVHLDGAAGPTFCLANANDFSVLDLVVFFTFCPGCKK